MVRWDRIVVNEVHSEAKYIPHGSLWMELSTDSKNTIYEQHQT